MKKNVFLIALLILLLFIPTYICIANYITINKTPVKAEDATEILITDPLGRETKVAANSEIANIIKNINANSQSVNSLPEQFANIDAFTFTFIEGTRKTKATYYFDRASDSAYFVEDAKGAVSIISAEDAHAFLESEYAKAIYTEAYVPEFSVCGTPILPSSYTWAYQTPGGSRYNSDITKTTDEVLSFTSDSGLSVISSPRTYETLTVTVKTPDGNVLKENIPFSELNINAKEHPQLHFDVAVLWGATEDNFSGGTANYSFILNIEAEPEFSIAFSGVDSDNKTYKPFHPGDIALITAYGIKDPSAVTFRSEPELTYNGAPITPKFFADGNAVYAFLPTTYETAAGEYKLIFTYNGIDYAGLTMTVEAKTFKPGKDFAVDESRVKATRTEETLAAYAEKVDMIIAGADLSTRHFDNTVWTDPDANADKKSNNIRGYGGQRAISSTREKYINVGIDYDMTEKDNILAAMDGEVIFASSTVYSGTMVAIDHGYGLISWYHNLDGVKVNVGDVVAKGTVIAEKVSDVGFTNGKTLHFRLTVFDVPVSAYDLLWSNTGISFK